MALNASVDSFLPQLEKREIEKVKLDVVAYWQWQPLQLQYCRTNVVTWRQA